MVNTFTVIMCFCTNYDEYGILLLVIICVCINLSQYGMHLHCNYDHVH